MAVLGKDDENLSLKKIRTITVDAFFSIKGTRLVFLSAHESLVDAFFSIKGTRLVFLSAQKEKEKNLLKKIRTITMRIWHVDAFFLHKGDARFFIRDVLDEEIDHVASQNLNLLQADVYMKAYDELTTCSMHSGGSS
ncbi:hypothetical protein ACJX0J_040657 [Zea mays]